MQLELIVKTRSLGGVSDLTLFAPIKPGLVPSLEAVTYKTRVKALLKALNDSRASSAEYALVRPFSDSVERVAAIHSVRVVVLEPEDKVMLAATYDGALENYVRVLWQKVGTLLDVIFCNTVDYVDSLGTYEAWLGWVRRVQARTDFFYGRSELTVPDVQYLRNAETLERGKPPAAAARAVTRLHVQSPEQLAWDAAIGPLKGGKPNKNSVAETWRQGLQALAVLYRLADYYVPASEDGGYLHRAARDLLLEFRETDLLKLPGPVRKRFDKQLAWFDDPRHSQPHAVPLRGQPYYDKSDVQGLILEDYQNITHGCLLLLAFETPQAAARLLQALEPHITRCGVPRDSASPIACLAFTFEGLRALGLSEAQLAAFPQEFREGMEARASVLGDFRANHPRRWRLPQRNWPHPAVEGSEVELSSVHAMLHLRTAAPKLIHIEDPAHKDHPLNAAIRDWVAKHPQVQLLSVQPMRRDYMKSGKVREHFGFADGLSQPEPGPFDPSQAYVNQVPLGDLLLGYENQADSVQPTAPGLLHNGSFLVVRKLSQNVPAFRTLLRKGADQGIPPRVLAAKMMGRTQNGKPLTAKPPQPGPNDFDYADDPHGSHCPFQSHMRRSNPRSGVEFHAPPGGVRPRIMRRGMSYGPRLRKPEDEHHERGIVFMAFNACIAEQFEVVQRWISGGNSSGTFSGQGDPFMAVPRGGDPRPFRFEHHGQLHEIDMDDADKPTDPPLVRLEWGAYLFTPSIKALRELQLIAEQADRPAAVWSATEGLQLLAQLEAQTQQLDAAAGAALWKSALEDVDERRYFRSASIWAAIREHHAGVLRTPFGVLVADRELAMRVFRDPLHHYSARGYLGRMRLSFGPIFLGLDDRPGSDYAQHASATNAAIYAIDQRQAFKVARSHAWEFLLKIMVPGAIAATPRGQPGWELNLDIKELSDYVLARLCEAWFGLPGDGGHLTPDGSRWQWQGKPLYPGYFTAPSRYMFQPRPGECPVKLGQDQGRALKKAVLSFLGDHRRAGTKPQYKGQPAPIGAAIQQAGNDLFPGDPAQADEWTASTFIGVLVGFLPSVDGNLRASLNEWLKDGTLWRLRGALNATQVPADWYQHALGVLEGPLKDAMQLRPAPETAWRMVERAHRLGPLDLKPDELVVISIVSATQQDLAAGKRCVYAVFGGERHEPPRDADPTHACPGYQSAMGVLLGIISALLEVPHTMRPSPAPLSVTVTGAVR